MEDIHKSGDRIRQARDRIRRRFSEGNAQAAHAAERRFASKISGLECLVAVQQRQIDEGNRMIRKMLSSGASSRRAWASPLPASCADYVII